MPFGGPRRVETQRACRAATLQQRGLRYRCTPTVSHAEVENCVENEIDFLEKESELCKGCTHDKCKCHYSCNSNF